MITPIFIYDYTDCNDDYTDFCHWVIGFSAFALSPFTLHLYPFTLSPFTFHVHTIMQIKDFKLIVHD
ncbi:MAG TPA: hypothetical protein DCO83_11645 [Mucilaginibacter sp.]|jgi:hypothetical protein|nr:hypothetical protein [Mucilaginibacter sp.]